MGYIPALDGVRAMAALGVLASHYLYPVTAGRIPFTFIGGQYGVDVFFALSGFLITTLLVEEHFARSSINLKAFWVRRALRLLPALLFVLCSLVILGALVDAGFLHGGQGLQESPTTPEGLSFRFVPFWPGLLISLLPISNWAWIVGYLFYPLGISWTLAIEDQFYFVWPFVLVFLLSRTRLSLRSIALIVLALAGAAIVWRNVLMRQAAPGGYQRTDFHLADLLLGCAFGLFVLAGMVPTGMLANRLLGILAWLSFVALAVITVMGVPEFWYASVVLIALLWIVMITHIATDRTSRLSALLSWAPLVGIGQVSYGLYLWHWVWLRYPVQSDLTRIPIAIALTSASVLISYYLIERPALRLKDRFSRMPHAALASPVRRSSRRLTRRDLMPIVGMSSVAVAAVIGYSLAIRMYAGSAESLGATSSQAVATPRSGGIPNETTKTPRTTRVPRADRARTSSDGHMKVAPESSWQLGDPRRASPRPAARSPGRARDRSKVSEQD